MGEADNGNLLTTEQAAAYLWLSRRTLERYRVRGGGQPFLSYCNRVLYLRSDLDAWVVERRRLSTSDKGQSAGVRGGRLVRRKKTPEGRLSVIELAALLRVSRRTLDRYRAKGIGPAFEKVEGRVLYFRTGLDTWIRSYRSGLHLEASPGTDRESGKDDGEGDQGKQEGES